MKTWKFAYLFALSNSTSQSSFEVIALDKIFKNYLLNMKNTMFAGNCYVKLPDFSITEIAT